jgi:hypothetical protein
MKHLKYKKKYCEKQTKNTITLQKKMNILPETACALSSRSGTNLPAALTLAGRKDRRCGCFFQNIHFLSL